MESCSSVTSPTVNVQTLPFFFGFVPTELVNLVERDKQCIVVFNEDGQTEMHIRKR